MTNLYGSPLRSRVRFLTPFVFVVVFFIIFFSARTFAGPFSDVPTDHWAYDAIEKLQEKGIMEGFDKKFWGNKPITRYEMAVILCRLICAKEDFIRKNMDTETQKIFDALSKEFLTKKEWDEFKANLIPKGEEPDLTMSALGVRISTLEEKTNKLQNDVTSVKKFQWWGFIRVRVWRPADGWDNIFNHGLNDGSYVDQLSVLSTRVNVNKDTQVNVSLSNRDFKQFNLGNSGFSNVIYSGWGDEKNAEGFMVYRAYVVTQTKFAKFSIGRQHWKFGPYGLLVMAPLKGAFGNGAVLAEKQAGKIKLTWLASLLPGNDKYLVGRMAIPVSRGELGLTFMPLGPGAVKNSVGADVSLGKFKAEAALLSFDKNAEPDNAFGVVAGYDVVKNKKTNVNVKLASIDGQLGDNAAFDLKIPGTTRTLSIIGEEDAEGVFRVGFKGVGITGTHKLNKRCTLSAEFNKGNSKSPVGFGKLTLSHTLSPSTDASLTLIQVGQNKSSRAVALRGELFVKF